MLNRPEQKYAPFPPIDLPNRQWPGRTIARAPQWLSTDLRDGNQAIFEPMDADTKLKFFHMLEKIGFKEIEVAFPSASQIEFDFVRRLINGGHIPDDVTIQVLTQARPELVARTMESLKGAKRAIAHVYTATSPLFRDVVFKKSPQEVIDMAVASIAQIRAAADRMPETEIILEYSPETFSQTELPYALEICNAAVRAWGATPQRKVILNLPATVEVSTPNIYADMIEWMHRNLDNRESITLSLHTHNDRGTAVAANELGLMAGADRIEGCLFGNGERTGNVDIVTLALNLYTQGVHPNLDFSNVLEIARAVERYTKISVNPRHPYVGDLVNTAFSGSHQDAIKKGLDFHKAAAETSAWNVPYLALDPRDVGRDFVNVIRVNSQSGKGGISYQLETVYDVVLPRNILVEFSGIVQKHAETTKGEVTPAEIWEYFKQEYSVTDGPVRYIDHRPTAKNGNEPSGIWLDLEIDGKPVTLLGEGNGLLDAAIHALHFPINIDGYKEQALGLGSDATALARLEISIKGVGQTTYGIGIHDNSSTAPILAVISCVNRALKQGRLELPAIYENNVAPLPVKQPEASSGEAARPQLV